MSDFEKINELYITVAGEGSFRIVPSKPVIVVEEKPGFFKLSNLTKAAFPIKIVNDSGKPFNWATNPKQFIEVSKPAPGTVPGGGSGATGGSCSPLFDSRTHVNYKTASASGSTTVGAPGAGSQSNITVCRFTAAPGDRVSFSVTATGHDPKDKFTVKVAECIGGKWVHSGGQSTSVSFTAQASGDKMLIISPVKKGDGGKGRVEFIVKGTTTKAGT